jgi:NAD(P)-dependent dehydrogenase (short-subunit alcohol dehydrogenase family)
VIEGESGKPQTPSMDLSNTFAFVAGASGDIGRAVAFNLLDAGAEVVMLGRSMPKLVATPPPETLRHKYHYIAEDLTVDGAAERIAAEISPRRRLDVLVLSLGLYERSFDPAVFDRQMAANVIGPYALLRQLLPLLVEAKGQIVFINSTQAIRASAEVGQYAATKHALKAIADSLRDEVNMDGVRVMSVFVGRTASERQRGIFATEGRPYQPDRLIQLADIAWLVRLLLQLPRTSEITDVVMRPMLKT